ncbi:MAG: GHKL domain-containing protein, partial [Eubacterium aggregans]
DNHTATLPIYTRDGSIHSTKHHGPGIGTASICHIVKRYNGDCRFEVVDGFFRASVRLPILPVPPSA